jgi:hypothetical protein
LVVEDFEQALTSLATLEDLDGIPWTAQRLQKIVDAYHAGHERICLDPEARNARHTYVTPSQDKKNLVVQQMLVDPDGHNDWVAEFEVDLTTSRTQGEPVLKLRRLGSLTGDQGDGVAARSAQV